MILTDAQRAAVDEEEQHVLVIACPGSGKTRTIVARLIRAIEAVRESPRRIACITYTNAGANEIAYRVRSYVGGDDAELCEVGTIHAFCIRSILSLFGHLIEGYVAGLAVVAPDSPEFEAAAADCLRAHGLQTVARSADFAGVRRGIDGEPLIPTDNPLSEQAVRSFWRYLQARSQIDFPNITYQSFRLLRDYPHIARTVSSRYPEFLIDEMQDTDALQVELLKLIANAGRSRFVLVGDPNQSILGFAGAEPQRMFDFAEHLDARTDFELVDNWRSSQAILRLADSICPRGQPMRAMGANRDDPLVPELIVAESASDAVIHHFLPMLEREQIDVKDAAVLAPNWFSLIPIAHDLRTLNVPVSGPGSRPYRRKRLAAGLVENICACVPSIQGHLLYRVQYELSDLVQNTRGRPIPEVWERAGRNTALRLIFCARRLVERYALAVPWLEAAGREFGVILVDCGLLDENGARKFREDMLGIAEEIRQNNNFDADQLSVHDLGTFANPDGSMKLLTLHSAKGREFEAVCLVDLQQGAMPHRRANLEEAKRVLYVGVTRPRRLLLLAHERAGVRSRFLRDERVTPYFHCDV